jgi:hypothetical protein
VMATMIVAAAASCSSAKPKECQARGGTSLCLRNVHSDLYKPEASGLKPGSRVRVKVAGHGLSADPSGGLQFTADGSGRFPSSIDGTTGVIVPPGSGPVTITITGTDASGAAVTATFIH